MAVRRIGPPWPESLVPIIQSRAGEGNSGRYHCGLGLWLAVRAVVADNSGAVASREAHRLCDTLCGLLVLAWDTEAAKGRLPE